MLLFSRLFHRSLDLGHVREGRGHTIFTWHWCQAHGGFMYELRHQARPLGSRSVASSSPHAPPARAAGWDRRTWAARGGASCCGAQVRAHAGVCLSELSGRAVGVSQQRLLSLKDRGRVSSPVPTQASLPLREGPRHGSARLAAAERQSAQGLAPNLSRSHSTILSWSFGACPPCPQAQRGQQHQPCPPQPARS